MLPRSTTRTGSLGARFWGQVEGFVGALRDHRGKGAASRETSQIAGKARYQARFPDRIASGRSLYGKEGVDGSSPSEGSAKAPQIGPFPLARTCTISSVRRVWSPLWSLQVRDAPAKAPRLARKRVAEGDIIADDDLELANYSGAGVRRRTESRLRSGIGTRWIRARPSAVRCRDVSSRTSIAAWPSS